MKKNESNYMFIDMQLINSLIKYKKASELINYAYNLEVKKLTINNSFLKQANEELKIYQNIIADYILSLKDKKLVDKLINEFIDRVDLFPDVYEKLCAKLIDNKTPEQAMAIYKKIKNQFFCMPSHTILKFISSSTKKGKTCLFFIKDLEESYKKHGNDSYDNYILDFYKRFRVVCTEEEFEQYVNSDQHNENDLEKQ